MSRIFMGLYVGIECVSMRHSTGILANADGQVLAATRMNYGLSYHTPPREYLRHRLFELFTSLAQRCRIDLSNFQNARVCIGLTGVTFPFDANVGLHSEIVGMELFRPMNIICTGDAEIAFASHAQRDAGSAILCHMGSTAYVRSPTTAIRNGGWGPAIGDEGSGYAMGRCVLRAIGREYDEQKPPSLLWNEVNTWLRNIPADFNDNELAEASIIWQEQYDRYIDYYNNEGQARAAVFSFAHWIERELGIWIWRSITSSLVVPLMRAAAQGDPVAGLILTNAVNDLTAQHSDAVRILGSEEHIFPIVLYGGVFAYNQVFRQKLLEALVARYSHRRDQFHVLWSGSPGTMRPACGALLYALSNSKPPSLKLPKPTVISAVLETQAAWPEMKND
jgi:N-acetylglucosamine kinase-like BadF-type ATPase